MATQNAQPQQGSSNKALDVIVMTLAVLIAAAGLFAFTFLTDQSMGVRIGALLGGLVVAVAAFSSTGKRFIAFCRESWEELRRVVWPTRKETVNTTGIVMAFVVAVAIYLFLVDKLIEWGLYDGLLQLSF